MEQHPKIQTAPDGSLLLNFGQYGEEVEVAAISGDGRRVLTVRAVGVAQVWDVATGRQVGEVRPESPLRGTRGAGPGTEFAVFIESAALDRDGSTALLGLNDGTAGTYRVSDGTRLATLHRPGEQPAAAWSVIRAVAYSPDGTLALVGFSGRSAGVWSERGERLVAFLESQDGSKLVGQPFVRDTLVSSIAMSADNRWLFAGHVDMTATIWEVEDGGRVAFTATEHAEDVVAVFDSADGFGWATTAGAVWESRNDFVPTKVLSSGEHWAEARFHGTRLLTRSFSDEIKLRGRSGESEVLFAPSDPPHGGWADNAETLDFRDDWILYPLGGQCVAARRGGESCTIDHEAQLVTSRLSPDGRSFATEGWANDMELWAIPGGELIHKFPSAGGVGDFAFSPDAALIAIGEIGHGGGRYARNVYIYETSTARIRQVHGEHQWQVARVEFSPDGKCLASLGEDIVVWDLDRKHVTSRIATGHSPALRFLPDGRLLVLDQGRARIYRANEQTHEWTAPIGFRTRWCVSEDGRTLSIALNQAVMRFDLETGVARGTWAAPIPRPDRIPDATFARQIEARTGAALWRTGHGMFLHQSDGPRGWVQPLQLSSEGLVAVPTADGAAVIRVGAEFELLGRVPFEGKLRASRFVDGTVLLVNEQGQLFCHRLPA